LEHYVGQVLAGHANSQGRETLGFLNNWLMDPEGDIFCSILGELGMGKTTLCQRLTRDLLDRRAQNSGLPLPVYLDLRAVNNLDWDWSRGMPNLESMLDRILTTNYHLPAGSSRPGVEDIHRLAQQHGGLIIFDGLDEVMNRLTPEHCQRFSPSSGASCPPPSTALTPGPARPGLGACIMTYRSHFFLTLQEQLDTLSGHQHESVKRQDYLWVDLLPFDGD